jgi:diphthine-ammonia ligase
VLKEQKDPIEEQKIQIQLHEESRLNVAILFSGGKDSCLALWYALNQGWGVSSLVAVQTNNPESYMFHYPNINWTRLQADAIHLPLCICESEGKRDDELLDLERCLSDLKNATDIEGVVSGAVESEYQKTRIDKISHNLNLASFSPLWRKDPEFLLREEVGLGFKIVISACMARGFTIDWLGREIGIQSIEELKEMNSKYGVHFVFEGGEAETFVTDGPIFKRQIAITSFQRIWKEDSGYLRIEKAELRAK